MLRLAMLILIIVELATWVTPMLPQANPAKPVPLDSTVVCPTRACKHWWAGNDDWFVSVQYQTPGWDFGMGVRWSPHKDICNLAIGKPRHGKEWLLQYSPDGTHIKTQIVALQSCIGPRETQ